jgi:hypothetical protein
MINYRTSLINGVPVDAGMSGKAADKMIGVGLLL